MALRLWPLALALALTLLALALTPSDGSRAAAAPPPPIPPCFWCPGCDSCPPHPSSGCRGPPSGPRWKPSYAMGDSLYMCA